MFRMASGPSGRTGRESSRQRNRRGAKNSIPFLLLLMAATSLGMSVLGGIVLFKLRNGAVDQPQPYVATADDLSAEKSVQRQAMLDFLADMKNKIRASKELPAAVTQPNDERREPLSGMKTTPSKRLIRQPKPKPSPVQPSEAPALSPAPSATEQAQALRFLNYLTDQIATIHIDLRNLSSRAAVAENNLRQLQDKGWFEWLTLGVTSAGIIHGLLSIAMAYVKWRQAKSAPATA